MSGANAPGDDVIDGDVGLFGPDSVTWRVFSDPAYPVAGMRALLLQALHPRAMAAVHQSGGFTADWWGRMNRTGEYVATIIFGSTREAQRAGARVRGIHRQLRGRDLFSGELFRIDSPDLLLWVHNTEIESMITTMRRSGLNLTDAEADTFVAEQVRAAELVGLDPADVPHDMASLMNYFDRVRPQLALTEPARQAAKSIISPPMASWVQLLTPARPAWQGLAALAFATLPPWARKMYRLPGLPTTDPVATASLKALRRTALAVPESWRMGPAMKAARARTAA